MPALKKKPYAVAQAELEQAVSAAIVPAGFELAGRDPNYGKGSSVTWTRDATWRSDELRLLFRWYGRAGHRGVYSDLSTRILTPERAVLVDGYPVAWIARNTSEDLKIREADEHAPRVVLDTLCSDIALSLAWLGRRYATPAAALGRVNQSERNGAGIGTLPHQLVVRELERLVACERTPNPSLQRKPLG